MFGGGICPAFLSEEKPDCLILPCQESTTLQIAIVCFIAVFSNVLVCIAYQALIGDNRKGKFYIICTSLNFIPRHEWT